MGASLNQIFSVLTQPAGSLIYHLILVFSIAGALQAAFVHWRSSEFPQARRTMFGLGMLLIAQIGLFLISGIGIEGMINLRLFLPSLDRAVTLFSLVWMIWLWAFPEPSRPADAATAASSSGISPLSAMLFAGLKKRALTPGIAIRRKNCFRPERNARAALLNGARRTTFSTSGSILAHRTWLS